MNTFSTRSFASFSQFAKWVHQIGRHLAALDGQYATAEWRYNDGTLLTMIRQADTKNQTGVHVLKWATSNLIPAPGHRNHAMAIDERGGGTLTITFM